MGSRAFNEIQHPKKRAFLLAYAILGNIGQAADKAGIERTTHHYWKRDPEYLAAFQDAKEMAAEMLEDEATRRAMGWDEERIAEDGTPYTMRKYSDTLLIVRLKAAKPHDYRDNVKLETDLTVHVESSLADGLKRLEGLKNVTPLHRSA